MWDDGSLVRDSPLPQAGGQAPLVSRIETAMAKDTIAGSCKMLKLVVGVSHTNPRAVWYDIRHWEVNQGEPNEPTEAGRAGWRQSRTGKKAKQEAHL